MREAEKKQSENSVKKPKMTAREGLLVAGKIILLIVWVGAVVLAMEYLVGLVLQLILSPEQLSQPIWGAVYSVIAYVASFIMIEFLTPWLENTFGGWRKTKIRKKTKKGTETVITVANDRKDVMYRPVNRKELGLSGWPTWLDIVFGILGYITTIVLAMVVTTLMERFAWFDAGQEQEKLFSPFIGGADRVIAFVILAIVAPMAEELIFRGWLYGKLRRLLGEKMGKWGAIVISVVAVSLLFGVLHGQWNVGVTVFILSAVACLLREMTGTIYAGTLVHIIQNSVAFYIIYVLQMGM